jgi:hypothetical protein
LLWEVGVLERVRVAREDIAKAGHCS